MRTKITRALLSVYDKTGIVEFARELARRGVELVSSGGTAQAIADAGIPVTAVDDITGVPPILDHRVVTLHPKIHGGILADRSKSTARRRHGDLRHPPVRPRRVEPLPVRAEPRHRDHRRRRARDGPRRGEEPRVRHHRHRRVAVRAAARRARRQRQHRRRRHPPRVRASRRSRARPRSTRRSSAWLQRDEAAARSTSTSRSNAPATRCATARTRTSSGARYRIAGTSSWWDSVEQHAGLALVVPQPLRRRRRVALGPRSRRREPARSRSSSTPTRAASRSPTTSPTAYQRALECDERSAFGGIVALQPARRRRDRRAHGRRPPGRPRDRPRLGARHRRRADRQAQEHPPARGGPAGAAGARLPPDQRGLPRAGRPPLRRDARRLARRHQARTHRRPSGATPSSPGASAVT